MKISEVFGYAVENLTAEAKATRDSKHCPFRNTPCTKSSIKNPIGVCSLSDDQHAAALCPARFLEGDRIFSDAAKLAFGSDVSFGIFPEVRILRIAAETDSKRDKKIGKVDFIIGKIEAGRITDFAAIEVQAVYFSGNEIRTPLLYFLNNGRLDLSNSYRRPDFRSSAQKRLIPQLQLKVPVFRRWGKKFFVVVDSQFFSALPTFSQTSQANSEVTWLSYPILKNGSQYAMQSPNIAYSEWDEVQNALREGKPPDPAEIMEELQLKLDGPPKKRPKILKS